MTIPRQTGRHPMSLRAAAVCAALLAATFVGVSWHWPPAAALAGGPPAATTSATDAVSTAAAASRATDAPPAPDRRDAATPTPSAPLPTFEELVDRLVAIGQRTAQLAQEDEVDAAIASDRTARTELAALMARFHDAGERALAMLCNAEDEAAAASAGARGVVLQVVLAGELARRHELALANDDHARIEPLVESLLSVMPQGARTTEVGVRLLDRQPYLRAAHERAVLALVQLAGDGSFPRDAAVRLLSTLWDNLQRQGARSSDELSRLAMLLLADADPARRTVACRQLVADPRYRAMAVAWLREHGDTAVAAELAGLAANELPPRDALQVLRELAPILPRAPSAYLVLGARAPEVVADAYRELLAANTQPDVRIDLVAGVGLTASEAGRDVVQLALHNDPSAAVRLQAGFVLTATGDADAGERALQQLLDDPAIARDPVHLGAIVLALHNLEADAATNAIDRLAQRLLTLPLDERGRQSLAALLARSLPAGQVSAPAGAGAR
jgi:hypothetical protein